MRHFGDIPQEFAQEATAEIVVIPIPYDGTSTWVKGADKGPEALIEASCNMELYDIETDMEVFTKGIYTAPPVSENTTPDSMTAAVYETVKGFLDKGKFVVGLGGEHSVSFGTIKAYSERYPDLTVLQLDAHTDLRDEYAGSIYNHACVMARAQEVAKLVQVGIRSMDYGEMKNLDQARVFWSHEINGQKEWINDAVELLTDHVFISIDLDVFDPSIMPSTGTPEPGGMGWYEVLDFLKDVIKRKNVVGFDVVELCPDDRNKAPDFLAAKLVYKLLSYKYSVI